MGGPGVTEKERQVRWMLRIFEKAVTKGDNRPGWHSAQGVDEFESVLSRAGLIQIGQWRMQEEAPDLREEQGPQQRCLRVVRELFEEVQAMLRSCPESEARILLEALRSSCSSAYPIWYDESQLKALNQFALSLWKVVDDVRGRKLFASESDAWWLMGHVQDGCVEILVGHYDSRRVHELFG